MHGGAFEGAERAGLSGCFRTPKVGVLAVQGGQGGCPEDSGCPEAMRTQPSRPSDCV